MEGTLTVIVTSTYKPHPGKARLVLSNMKENVEAFGAMGMTCRISRIIFGPDTGSLVFSFFSENFSGAMGNAEKIFSSEVWAKIQMRLDDNPSSELVMPPNIFRTVAGEMSATHRVINYRWYLMKRDKVAEALEMFSEVKSLCEKVDINPVMIAPVTGEPMSSLVVMYGAKSLAHAGEALDGMGMGQEMQQIVAKAASLGELHRAWMTVPAE